MKDPRTRLYAEMVEKHPQRATANSISVANSICIIRFAIAVDRHQRFIFRSEPISRERGR